MNRLVFLLALAIMTGPLEAAEPVSRKPNIVVIMADDMGYSDLGCMGGEIATPNLDALAAGGLRFTQFYNTARCCPTRASLLTGLYAHQAGVGLMMEDLGKDHPGYRGNLNRSCRTIAEVLGTAGYRNYMVGKWHVSRFIDRDGPKDNWPLARGFDRYYGTLHGAGSYFDPSSLVRDNTMISAYADPEYRPATYYYTDAISDNAVRYLGEHCRGEHSAKPFFLYMAYTSPHWPMQALPEDIRKYQGKYDAGYESVRKARFDRMAKKGLIDPAQGLSPQKGNWNAVVDKKWEAAGMEVYAAMIDRMDQGIGKLVAELKRTGQLENTLILFLQDNGGCAEPMGRSGDKNHPNIERPEKPTFTPLSPEALITRGSVPLQTRDGYPVRMGPKVMPGNADTYVAYGPGWANVSNTPFREFKHWAHEGGISTPLIAHWPAGITSRGSLRSQPGHVIDIAATCYQLAGATYPRTLGEQTILPLEGRSLVPAFADDKIKREGLFWEHHGNRAVRMDNWKLVAREKGSWELYDLSQDRTESHDLAREMPDRVATLKAAYNAWARRCLVEP